MTRANGGRWAGGDGEHRADVVDDVTFDLLQALTSKLEAIDAYREYAGHDGGGVFDVMLEDEIRHAEILLEALRKRLS